MTAEEYQSYIEGLPFSFSPFALQVFFRQPWMTKTGKQTGEVSTAWFCQLKELGFCSKPSFVLYASSLNYCSRVLSRGLDDPCGLRTGWSTLVCEWCTCVVCLLLQTHSCFADEKSIQWLKRTWKVDGSTFSVRTALLCHAVKCHVNDRYGKVPSIQA